LVEAVTPFPELRAAAPVRRLLLVLGDQLDSRRGPLLDLDPARDAILMVEARGESTAVPSHVQRTVQFLSAMRHYALDRRHGGLSVEYVPLDQGQAGGDLGAEIEAALRRLRPVELQVVLPGDWRVLRQIEAAAASADAPLTVLDDPHFLTTPAEFEGWASGRKELILEYFYRWQRKRLDILLGPDGKPVGGAWNFDKENRASFKEAPRIPAPYRPRVDAITREVIELVARELPDLPGRVARFEWPVTREQALRALGDFIAHRLPSFGRYQDAMWTGETTLYHARLSAAMNLKLLDPLEVIRPAVEAWEAGAAPLASVEGFVRQVIGWREFIRGVYWREGPGYGERNSLDHHGRLPDFYWSGETDLECLRQSIGQVLDEGYGHHIQRLMVTGNFALIAGIDPRAVTDWYLGMFTDGVDWVTLPNTLGMALHADGGVVGTKPYAASGKYIDRMSDHCGRCVHDVKRRTGEGACPFNTLYWDFLSRHRERFAGNRRMAMILRNLDRFDEEERARITSEAEALRETLGIGPLSGEPPA